MARDMDSVDYVFALMMGMASEAGGRKLTRREYQVSGKQCWVVKGLSLIHISEPTRPY